GVEGSMQQTAGAWGPMATLWRCAGTKGTVWTENGKVFLADRQGTRELDVPDDLALTPPELPEGANPMAFFELAPFIRLCREMRDTIEGKQSKSPVPPPTFRDGLASMQILDAIHASAADGGSLQKV